MSELRKLPDSKVFSRDPETWDNESLTDAKVRLVKIAERLDRLRGLDKPKEQDHIQLDLLGKEDGR